MKKILLSLIILTAGFFGAYSQTIINPGFEEWEVDSSSGTPIMNPKGWEAFNFGEDPDAVSPSTDAHGGKYSARIIPTTFFGFPFPGILGYTGATTQKLKYLNGYYKAGLAATDTFIIGVNYTNSKTGEEYGFVQIASGSKSAWTPFNFKVDLPAGFTPDTVYITIVVTGSGNAFGMLDNLSFSNTPIGNPFGKEITNSVRGIHKVTSFNERLSPNPANDFANLDFYLATPQKVQIVITDLLGKEIKQVLNNDIAYGQQHIQFSTGELNPGIYFYTILTSNSKITRKFIVNH